MRLQRRQLLLAASSLLLCSGSWGQPSPLDAVRVYLVPLDDFPEELASSLARSLQNALGFRIKASLRLPPLRIDILPGTNQLVAESILAQGAMASARLPEAAPTSYRIFLTLKDINSRSANFRFQFSSHDKSLNCSVVSLARLIEYTNERPLLTERSLVRLLKMTKRAIGEMYLGWSRSTDPNDIMFSPLMSLDDLDRIGLEHTPQPKENEQTPRPPKPAANTV